MSSTFQPGFTVSDLGDYLWFSYSNESFAVYCKSQQSLDQFRFNLTDKLKVTPTANLGHYHNATMLGVNSKFVMSDVPARGKAERVKFEYIISENKLELDVNNDFFGPRSTVYITTFTIENGKINCRMNALFKRAEQKEFEVFNLFLSGLEEQSAAIENGKKDYTLWKGQDGQTWKHENSHVFSFLTIPTKRLKYLDKPSAETYIGFGPFKSFNPLWIVTKASPRLTGVATCDMWFDQHLCLDKPGLEHRDEEGYFISEMELLVTNEGQEKMEAIAASSKLVSNLRSPSSKRDAICINVEGKAKLNQCIGRQAFSKKPMAIFPSWYKTAQALDFNLAPSGEALLCFSPGKMGANFFNQWDPMPKFGPNRRIHLRVKGYAKGLNAPARIGLTVTRFGRDDIQVRADSQIIENDGPFERSVTVENGIYNFVLPYFERQGDGGLWFEELSLSSEAL